ncbi:hypothetical protein [Nonomuraea turcica]|uniref:hypothetical protein n=1 Tax=Nonomuraea sp. G32 TaxID=3067274 RepID=UPI00273A8C32|nr:hypothetical protein [Nonomuraea sp. G32]MDP4505700.1 hypothetical protein [Nonomuraea sp. G32]
MGRALRLAAECGFAAAAIDAPAHGDRPKTAEHDRIITEMQARMADAGDPVPLLAELHTLLAAQTVPEWRSVLDALGDLGPVGYWACRWAALSAFRWSPPNRGSARRCWG